jgi:glycosyltransferase involved in cell wall biosynthesis
MISVVLPTHNPHPERLRRTLAGLQAQTLPASEWEFVLVDNASAPSLATTDLAWHAGAKIVFEPKLGLTAARLRGIRESRGALIVFVDDDNVLEAHFLENVAKRFANHSRVGVGGGPVMPEFEAPPPAWLREFWGLLALHEHGPNDLIAMGSPDAPWPDHAPVGAGLCVRRAALDSYLRALDASGARRGLDRTGASLASGGDSDLVFSVLHAGYDLGYFPELKLVHLIPATRLQPEYLARLNRGIMRTWVRVLSLHGHCPWRPIARWTVGLRYARAVWRHRNDSRPAREIRLAGRLGQFEGLADIGAANAAQK